MDEHKGDLIPFHENAYAYECCPINLILTLKAQPPRRGENSEGDTVAEYVLDICRHTGTSLVVTLRKVFNANRTVQQRKDHGFADEAEVFTTVMSFQELVNRLLGPGCDRFFDHENFPDSAKEAMKQAYPSG